MKINLLKSIAVAGLLSLAPALWALAPSGYIYSSAFITPAQSVTVYAGVYASSDYDSDNDFYSEDPITGYDVYVDGVLTQSVGDLYSLAENIELTYAGSSLALGTHYVDVFVNTASGDGANFSTEFTVGDLGTAYTINLQSFRGDYVCAEGGGWREVVANRSAPGGWETFTLFDLNGGALESGDKVVIRGYWGSFFCAEGGGGGNLVANRRTPAIWEQFTLEKVAAGGSITSGSRVSFRAFNGQYWSAEEGGGGLVNANRDGVAVWEEFTITLQ